MNFDIRTLGCKVNTYESNVMSDLLLNAGFKKSNNIEETDIFIINTCTVTNTADNKSLKLVRQVHRINKNAIIVVCGCMPQKSYEKVSKLDGVSIILGNKNKSKIVDYINRYLKERKQIIDVVDLLQVEFEDMRLNNFDHTRAFVKIQDGCNNFCSYCIIPYTRGNVRSKKREHILEEVMNLVEKGHKEIVLTGIHTGNYGAEFKNYRLFNLLEELVNINGLERLRISSIEITEITDDVLNILAKYPILVDHLHIPLQAGSDPVLKRMNRKYDVKYFLAKLEAIRQIRPDISITTDIIVGFPGETEEEFIETLETSKKCGFTKIHVFPYSLREGTKAESLPNHIDEETKKKRVKELMSLSKELEISYMKKFINKKVIFIPEIIKDGYLYGHTGNYLYVKAKGCLELLNKDVEVKLEDISYPYVVGKIE